MYQLLRLYALKKQKMGFTGSFSIVSFMGLFVSTIDLYKAYKENVENTSQVTLNQFYKDI